MYAALPPSLGVSFASAVWRQATSVFAISRTWAPVSRGSSASAFFASDSWIVMACSLVTGIQIGRSVFFTTILNVL
jgi:hypothetical protein